MALPRRELVGRMIGGSDVGAACFGPVGFKIVRPEVDEFGRSGTGLGVGPHVGLGVGFFGRHDAEWVAKSGNLALFVLGVNGVESVGNFARATEKGEGAAVDNAVGEDIFGFAEVNSLRIVCNEHGLAAKDAFGLVSVSLGKNDLNDANISVGETVAIVDLDVSIDGFRAVDIAAEVEADEEIVAGFQDVNVT